MKRDVTKALLPDVLDMTEVDGIGKDYTSAREAAYQFDKIDEGLLAPYANRIVALLGKGPEVRDILLPTIGRIGVDPLPYLMPFSADRAGSSHFYPRVIGACRSDPHWAAELIAALRGALLDVTGTKYDDLRYRDMLFKALTNLGDRGFVEQEIARLSQSDGDQIRRELALDTSRKDPANWLCRW